MPRFPGRTATEIRSLVPAAEDAWGEIETNVLRSGVVDQKIKELCYRAVANQIGERESYPEREQAVLDWTYAIAYDSSKADDDLWRRLHGHFTEPELVDLGCAIGFEIGRQHWRRSVGLLGRGD